MDTKEIAQIIEKNRTKYDYFGIRAMTMNPITREFEIAEVGKPVSNSYDWDDGETTGYQLNGVSAVEIVDIWDEIENSVKDALKAVKDYDDRSQVVLIGSIASDHGSDAGEIIMHGNDTVLAIIR